MSRKGTKVFSDWDSLVSAVKGVANEVAGSVSGGDAAGGSVDSAPLPEIAASILIEDVAPIAEEILLKNIKSGIYNAYNPSEYKRRYTLLNYKNLYSSVKLDSDGATLTVTSLAIANKSVVKGHRFRNKYPGAFLKLIEEGKWGIWHNGFPRPAISNTQSELDSSSQISDAINAGLKRRFG